MNIMIILISWLILSILSGIIFSIIRGRDKRLYLAMLKERRKRNE